MPALLDLSKLLVRACANTGWSSSSNAAIEVTTINTALWPATNRFVCFNDPLRYSPAIHVNQAGYSPNSQNKAMVGYYRAKLGEMQISNKLGFKLIDSAGALNLRAERSGNRTRVYNTRRES